LTKQVTERIYVDKNTLCEIPYVDEYGFTGSPNGVWVDLDENTDQGGVQ